MSYPNILRAEIDEIILDAHLNDKVKKEMLRDALEVKGLVDPHALYPCSAKPCWRQQQQKQHQPRQQPHARWRQGWSCSDWFPIKLGCHGR